MAEARLELERARRRAEVALTEEERDWVALTILDAAAERSTDDAARLVEARMESLLNRRAQEAVDAALAPIEALADQWRYKGEFGWGPWQIGEGPDPEGEVLDRASTALRAAIAQAREPRP